MDSLDLDLDLLQDRPKKVKIGGEIIEVSTPNVEELAGLMGMYKTFTSLQSGEDFDTEDIKTVLTEIRDLINKQAPKLKDVRLNMDQTIAVLDLIIKGAVPQDTKAMEEKGITFSPTDEKKILSNSENKSLTS